MGFSYVKDKADIGRRRKKDINDMSVSYRIGKYNINNSMVKGDSIAQAVEYAGVDYKTWERAARRHGLIPTKAELSGSSILSFFKSYKEKQRQERVTAIQSGGVIGEKSDPLPVVPSQMPKADVPTPIWTSGDIQAKPLRRELSSKPETWGYE